MKKYNGTEWVDTTLRQYKTATDTITTLPAVIYADGNNATVGLKGNTVQNGTPTPSNPVDVNGVGVMTENLFDGSTSATNQRLSTSGTGTYAAQGYSVSRFIEIEPSTYYTITTGETSYYNLYNENKQYIYGSATNARIPDSYANARYIRFDFKTENIPSVMLVKGSTAPSAFEPYGYKIPISNGQTTTNIYLGSTQTVRQIRKYVMTGNETISNYASDFQRYVITIPTIPSIGTRLTPIICTHYIGIYDGRPAEQVPMNAVYTGAATGNSVLIKTDQTTDRNTFIAWLQEQYANGTPVTLWYAVSTPETAAVNEPLMKIGDYADTLSNATAIPTTEGANSITVDTTVQPSEFTATWTGWHDTTVKEWDGSQWQ